MSDLSTGRPGVSFTPEQEAMIEEIVRHDTALALWNEWFEKDGDPVYASEMGGDPHCFFCGSHMPIVCGHEEDCIYIRAKRLTGRLADDELHKLGEMIAAATSATD